MAGHRKASGAQLVHPKRTQNRLDALAARLDSTTSLGDRLDAAMAYFRGVIYQSSTEAAVRETDVLVAAVREAGIRLLATRKTSR